MPDDTDAADEVLRFCFCFCFFFFLRCLLSLSTLSSELIDEPLGERLLPLAFSTARKMPVERAVSSACLRLENSSAKRFTHLSRTAARWQRATGSCTDLRALEAAAAAADDDGPPFSCLM